ncbi:MAG: cardiolipin synthase [Candidatus Methanomethylophilaceae archaeon]|nr:cardiolipin synthase [Candidatus Methanomethylophilaceae archaeon]
MIDWLTQFAIEMDVIFLLFLFFSERGHPAKLIMWALAFIFLPVVGFVIYLFIGQSFYSKHVFSLKGVKDDKIEDEFKIAKDDIDTESDPDYRELMTAVHNMGGLGYSRDNNVRLYTLGEDKFKDMYEDLRAAKDFINIEYYIVRNDELGNELLEILTQKVKEGVEVRFLTDYFGVGKGPKAAIKKFRQAGGKFGAFHNVIWLMFSPKKNNRNHRKIAVIDGKIAYCGGFNVGDEYLGKGPLGFWRDTAVRITGSAVKPLMLRFQMDWEYATKEPLSSDREGVKRFYPDADQSTSGETRIITVSGGPDVSDFNPVRLEYLALINRAKKSVYLHSPYFIPDDSLQDALTMAAARGVDVRVIIPDKPDHMFVFWNNIRCAYTVMGNGVKVYMYNRGFVHSKTMVVDGEYCSVGSANFDDRSLVLNFETNAMILSKEIGRQMDEAFMEDLEYCTEYTREDYENLNGYQQARVAVSRLFSSLS